MKLSAAEYEIMDSIWKLNREVSSADIMETLGGQRGWKQPTVLTFLSRLCEKGLLTTVKNGKIRNYTALISRESYNTAQTQELLQTLYAGSVQNMVACMTDAKGISEGDLSALRAWLKEREPK